MDAPEHAELPRQGSTFLKRLTKSISKSELRMASLENLNKMDHYGSTLYHVAYAEDMFDRLRM